MNIKTKKIEIITEKKNCNTFIEELQKFGKAEIISENPEKEIISKDTTEKLKKIKASKNFLKKYKEQGNFFTKIIKSFLPRQREITSKKLDTFKGSEEIKNAVKESLHLKKIISELKPKKEKLEKKNSLLEKFSDFSIAKPKKELKNFNYVVGEVPISKEEELKEKIEENISSASLNIKENEKARGKVLSLIYPKEKEDFINKIIKDLGIKTQELFWEKPPKIIIKENNKKIEKIEAELFKIEKETKKLTEFIPQLEALIDYYSWEIKKNKFLNQAQASDKYLSIKAWVPEDKIKELKKRFPNCLIKKIPLDKKEKSPIIIENGNFKPFEIVTKVYGLPKKNEIDPTLYLAPFFSFQFAFALSDAGYGLILAAVSYVSKKLTDDESVKTFFNLFIVGGILTAIVGVFAGTFFGTDLTKGLRLIDPLKNPIDTLIFISYIGAFQIFVGILIGMIWKIKQGKIKEAIGKEGGSILLFIGTLMFLLSGESIYAISGLVGMMFLGAVFSTANNFGLKILSGIGSLYDIVGYFSDILSYSRLLALGLATGIIAMVVNMVAFMFKDMIPIPGLDIVIAGIILVVGHTMNLMINSLGAFIHSARLQFVEFFSKFMEGGGKRFNPFSKKGYYIKVSDN